MLIQLNKKQQKFLYVLTFITLAIGIFFLRPYLLLIVFSAIMAVLFNPIYLWLLKKGKSKGKASFYTFIASFFIVIIPLIFVIIISGVQIANLVDSLDEYQYSIDTDDLLSKLVNSINEVLASLGISTQVSVEAISTALADAVKSFGESLLDNIGSFFSGFFNLITAAIIYIYVFLSILKNQESIIKLFQKLNPLSVEVADLYMDRTNAMTKATVRGQFIIAFMQGAESAAVLALVGMPELFFFFLITLTVMSFIPLGAGIITIPIGIFMILTGNVWQGAVVILNHLLIVTKIDNIMRPLLVPKSARLDPALMILAVFSGIALFGFLGIVIGPIIMILIATTIQLYLEVFFKEESIDRSKDQKLKRFSKIRGLTKNTVSKIKPGN